MTDDVEPQNRRSRLGWTLRTAPTTTPAGTHDHAQRNGPLFLAFFCIVGLFLVNAGLIWFILARGEARDAAEKRIRLEIHNGQCELLDAFPAAPLLDDVRHRFHCGPGRPVSDFPPEVQQNLTGSAPATTPATPLGVESSPEGFALPGGADANAPKPEPHYPTPGVAEPPATVPYPPGFPPPDPVQPTAPGLLSPVTGLVCDLAGVCLKESP